MTINNPFTSGQIKNYILLYASIVVIMILFFIASTLFNDIKDLDKKEFNTQVKQSEEVIKEEEVSTPKFKLLDKAY
jgi:1,4-dihydroxy-2-naphthoate octaprenyltransferase